MASPQALSSIASSVLFGGPPSAPPPPSAPASSSSSGTLQGGGLVGSSSTQQQSNQALGSLSSSGYVGAAHHVPTHRSYAHNSSRIRRHIDDTLGRGGDLAEACRLPPGEDVREWHCDGHEAEDVDEPGEPEVASDAEEHLRLVFVH